MRKVILITDGDKMARKTIEVAAKNVGGCCISASSGNPTPISGEEIVKLIKKAQKDPVLVMLDDKGCRHKGAGEKAMEYIVKNPEVDVLGVIAVASNTSYTHGVSVKNAISLDGKIIDRPVDKEGYAEPKGHHVLEGDTVDVLEELDIPIIIGIGDIGKMHGKDHYEHGAPITTKAVNYILQRNGYEQ